MERQDTHREKSQSQGEKDKERTKKLRSRNRERAGGRRKELCCEKQASREGMSREGRGK